MQGAIYSDNITTHKKIAHRVRLRDKIALTLCTIFTHHFTLKNITEYKKVLHNTRLSLKIAHAVMDNFYLLKTVKKRYRKVLHSTRMSLKIAHAAMDNFYSFKIVIPPKAPVFWLRYLPYCHPLQVRSRGLKCILITILKMPNLTRYTRSGHDV